MRNQLMNGALGTPQTVVAGNQVSFAAAALVASVD